MTLLLVFIAFLVGVLAGIAFIMAPMFDVSNQGGDDGEIPER